MAQKELKLTTAGSLRQLFVSDVLKSLEPSTILDIGGWDGEMVGPVKGKARLTIIDLNDRVQESKKNNVDEFIIGNAYDSLEIFKGRKFDIVTLCEVLEHQNFEGAVRLIQIALKLAPFVVITVPFERAWTDELAPFTHCDHKQYFTESTFLKMIYLSSVLVYYHVIAWGGFYFFTALVRTREGL